MGAKIFVSWSGERSRMIAEAITVWLPRVIQMVETWMSDVSIVKGERWSGEISQALSSHDMGIFCITPENYNAPWLAFEAGALSTTTDDVYVCPLLFGMSLDDMDGPLTQFQATIFDKDDFFDLLQAVNDLLGEEKLRETVLRDVYDRFWPPLESEIETILATKLQGRNDEIRPIVKAISNVGITEPVLGDYAYFNSGYESHQLYSTVVAVADTRLFVYGRKNRKLFDKEYYDFFEALPEKLKDGFKFRALFLNPNAPENIIMGAHQDADFREQLLQNILKATKTLKMFGVDPVAVCRVYDVKRPHGLMIVDDAVLHSPFEHAADGSVKPTTKSAFSVVGAHSSIGSELIREFIKTWDEGQLFDF